MELRHLRYFKAVAENGGFARAARLLHVAQSAVSGQIRDLEKELGVSLFDRSKRQVRLTRHGELFLKDAASVLVSADCAVANVQRSLRGEVGMLTVGFLSGGNGSSFPKIIKEFKHLFPGVQVSLVEMTTAMHHKALEAGTIDVAFTRPPPPAKATILRFELLQSVPLAAVMSKSHRLAKKRTVLVRELADERFVLILRENSPFLFSKVITLCAEAGFSPQIGTTASNAAGVIALVEAGEGVAIFSRNAIQAHQHDLASVRLADPAASIPLVIAWAAQRENSVLRSFINVALKNRKKP